MEKKKDIENIEDIKVLINSFYEGVRKDELIGPIFDEKIQNRWPEHLDIMYTFWETLLLDNHSYKRKPFPPHADLPVEKRHFDRWLTLFEKTLYELFEGHRTDEALWRAENIALMFQRKIKHIRENPDKPLLI